MATIASRKKSIIANQAMTIESPVANTNMLLNKSAASSTSLYQQCSQLRAKLLRIKGFEDFFNLGSTNSARQSTDPVTQLWDLFSLGVPLCFLFNLLPPPAIPIQIDTSPASCNIEDLRLCKRAIALFTMKAKDTVPGAEPFTVTELTDRHSNDGLVKVITTVTTLVGMLPEDRFQEASEEGLTMSANPSTDSLPSDAPVDAQEAFRNHTTREIVETERKFVQDLEIMQRYANALAQGNIISHDTIHLLFPGLNKLLNFQRTFLIKLEGTAEQPWKDQRWGNHFIENEDEFAVYEPYCANYISATELMLSEQQSLSALNHVINGSNELGAFLIKPIQRICKYPLLLESLLKAARPETYPHYEELQLGYAAARRVTDTINEAQRRAENRKAVRDLEHRVLSWKGHNLSNFGELLLDSVFRVTKSDVDRDYHVFLFEKIILCCKEAPALPKDKKAGKSTSYISKSKATPPPLNLAPDASKTPLLLKGRIFLNNVTQAVAASPRSTPGSANNYPHSLSVYWRGDDDLEFFTLRCRNEDQMKQWETAINKLIQASAIRRAAERGTPMAPIQKAEIALAQSSYGRTPSISNRHDRSLSNSVTSAGLASPTPSHATSTRMRPSLPNSSEEQLETWSNSTVKATFELEGEDEYEDYPPTSAYPLSGRGTPLATRRSNGNLLAGDRESTSGQWRSESPIQPPPSGALPPPPPNGARPMNSRVTSDASFGPGVRTRNVRPSMTNGLMKNSQDGSVRSVTPSLTSASSVNTQPLVIRSRSSSQPAAYIPQPNQPLPPVPGSQLSSNAGPSKRESGSSQSTDESTDYSPPNSSSPITPYGSSESAIGAVGLRGSRSQTFEKSISRSNTYQSTSEPAAMFKVHYFEDIFIIKMPRTVQYSELVDKVAKKITLCGRRRDEGPLRVKYQDEDGDLVSLGSTEDVQMALEQYLPGTQVSLFVQ